MNSKQAQAYRRKKAIERRLRVEVWNRWEEHEANSWSNAAWWPIEKPRHTTTPNRQYEGKAHKMTPGLGSTGHRPLLAGRDCV